MTMFGKMQHRTGVARSAPVAAGVVLGLMCSTALPSQAQTYSVLHSFTGKPNDGAFPNGLVLDRDGNLYGTTNNGGSYDVGTAFKIDTAGNETVLTSFDYDREFPQPGVIVHKGILYDSVLNGGYFGGGAVVKINDRRKAYVYSFCALANCADGANPLYGVTRDSAGNLYGTTQEGGAYRAGVVFKVDSRA